VSAAATPTRARSGPEPASARRTRRPAAASPSRGADVATSAFELQHAAGNRAVSGLVRSHGGTLLQRKCACGGTCKNCATDRLQRKRIDDAPLDTVPAIVDDVLSAPGRTLDPAMRAFMEARFGHDFSGVRVHADPRAAASARAVHAHAYAVGRHLVFGDGRFATATAEGRELLAHELAHVVQQSRGGASGAGDGAEHEADRAARLVARGGRAPALTESAPVLARKDKKDAAAVTKRMAVTQSGASVVVTYDGAPILTVTHSAGGSARVDHYISDDGAETVFVVTPPDSNATSTSNMAAAPGVIYSQVEPEMDEEGFTQISGYTFALQGPAAQKPKTEKPKPKPAPPPAPPPIQQQQEKKEEEKKEEPEKLPDKTPKELIDDNTTARFLDEDALGATLLKYALSGDRAKVEATLDELDSTDRDDVSRALLEAASEEDLAKLAETEEGRRFLARLKDELTSGYTGEDEVKQAERINTALVSTKDPEKLLQEMKTAPVIPFSSVGWTKLSSASISAWMTPEGKIRVRSHMKPEHYQFAKNTTPQFRGRIETMDFDPDQMVGLYLIDEGGKQVYVPAVQLLQMSNQETTKLGFMAGEAVVTGITLGLGGGAVAGGEATASAATTRGAVWAGRALTALKWGDRVATVAGAATTLINDHRGLIIKEFGKDGEAFLEDWRVVETVLQYYAIGRGAVALGQTGAALRGRLKDFKARRAQMKLSAADAAALDEMTLNAEKTLDEIDAARATTGKATGAPGAAGALDDPSLAGTKPTGGKPAPGGFAPADEPVLAKKPVGGGHDIEITAAGASLCSPKPCPLLRTRYARELAKNPALAKELDEIDALRKTKPDEAAKRAADLHQRLETERLAGGGARAAQAQRLPDDVVDDLIAGVEDLENRAMLDVSKKRGAALQSGEKNLTDLPVGFDVDEPLAVGAPGVKPQRQVKRAMDPHNRQLLDPAYNRQTKGTRTSAADISRNRVKLEPVSVAKDPGAIFTRRFDEVVELQQIFDEAVAKVGNPGSMKPTELKAAINRNIRDIIRDGKSPAGIAVRDALKAQGFEFVPGRGIVAVKQP
jgi:hypothetical protein